MSKGLVFVSRGFTLIELMIVMTVVVILSGVSVASYLNFNKYESINNDARAFQGELLRVKSLSASLEYPLGCVGLQGYKIESQTVAGKLAGTSVTAMCDSGNVVEATKTILVNSTFSTAFSIVFLPGTGFLQGGVVQNIILTHPTDPLLSKTVSINSNGIIISL